MVAFRPTRRSGTNMWQFERRIPKEMLKLCSGKEMMVRFSGITAKVKLGGEPTHIRFSLRTPVYSEARVRMAAAWAFVDVVFDAWRRDAPVELKGEDIGGLLREHYKRHNKGPDDESLLNVDPVLKTRSPRDPEWEEIQEATLPEMMEHGATDMDVKPGVKPPDQALREMAISLAAEFGFPNIDEHSVTRLAAGIKAYQILAAQRRAALAALDFGPDTVLDKLPEMGPVSPTPWAPPRKQRSVSIVGLVETWWEHSKPLGRSQKTYDNYKKAFALFQRYMKHDDALRVRPEDIEAYKTFRLTTISEGNNTGKPISAESFRLGDWVALRSVFRWAAENKLIPESPMPSIRFTATRKVKLRDKNFTDAEASALLAASSNHLATLSRAPSRLDYAKRWVPWLCAYSGCRVGEAVQLRKEDFRKAQGHLIMLITPEAGTVKTKEAREVPIHSHILEEGFDAFLKASAEGYLFLEFADPKGFRSNWLSRKNEVTSFARLVVTDRNVAPSHGWRHTFKSKGFEAGIQEKVLDAICGHAPSSVGRAYGSVSLKTRIDAILQFPRYEIESKTDGQAAE